MNGWRARVLGISILLSGVGCQLSDSADGLQLSRMIPKSALGSAGDVPPQSEPDPDSLYGAQPADDEAVRKDR